MQRLILIFILVCAVSCGTKNVITTSPMNPAQNEAIVYASIIKLDIKNKEGADCGNKQCYASLQIDSVLNLGQQFPQYFDISKPILAYFSFGIDGANNNTHTGLHYSLEKLDKNSKIQAIIKLYSTKNNEKVYKVDYYKKLN